MYQPHLVAMVDWVTFGVKTGYFWSKCRLIWAERGFLRPNLPKVPNGIQARIREMVGWRKTDRLSCLVDEPQNVFQMVLAFRAIRSAMAG
jgi:hypothetical protein